MTLTKAYRQYLKADAARVSIHIARREAIKEMQQQVKGKTRKELEKIWHKQLEHITRQYFRSFPNAMEKSTNNSFRWRTNTNNKRKWWVAKMLGEQSSVTCQSASQYLRTLERSITTVTSIASRMKGCELRKMGQLAQLLIDAINQNKAKLDDGTSSMCVWCETRRTRVDKKWCSHACKKQHLEYEKHKERAA